MFVNIESFLLNTCRNAKSVNLIECLEDDESHACCPDTDHKCSEYLCSEEAESMSVEYPLAGRE